jgi:hypothetical protein
MTVSLREGFLYAHKQKAEQGSPTVLLRSIPPARGARRRGIALYKAIHYQTLPVTDFDRDTCEKLSHRIRPINEPSDEEAHTMRDNLRRYRAIRDALTPWYPGEPTGNLARHVTTLAALISGMVASKSTQLPQVASQVPDGSKPESRVKRFTRCLGNDRISKEVYFLPSADVLLERLALQTLVVVIDGSVVGRGCVALMIHVVSKGRALPLCWLVRHGKKGHVPEDLHIALVEQVQEMIPPGASVVLLGDAACDGTGLQQTLEDAGLVVCLPHRVSPDGNLGRHDLSP